MLNPGSTLYLWSRHADGMPPDKALAKWNRAYPDQVVTPTEQQAFLSYVQKVVDGGGKSYVAIHDYLTGAAIPTMPKRPKTAKKTKKKE